MTETVAEFFTARNGGKHHGAKVLAKSLSGLNLHWFEDHWGERIIDLPLSRRLIFAAIAFDLPPYGKK